MKRLLVLVTFTVLFAVTTKAQSCAKCYWPPWGSNYCGLTTYNGSESCRLINGYICELVGDCEGLDGPDCADGRPCPHQKWACGSRLPEKAPWVVATVEVRKPEPERERTKS